MSFFAHGGPDGKYAGYWKIKRFRRRLRDRISHWLARHRAATAPSAPTPLDPARIGRVIVCRRNNRLGNMLMLTPLLRTLSAAMPQAEIDLLIGSRDYSQLFQGLPGIRRVWVMPARGWGWPLRMLYMLFRLRRQHYDLCVEPSQNSFSNRLSARLCGATSTLGFYTPDQWLDLTHAVAPDPAILHDALKPLQLVRDGILGGVTAPAQLHLELSPQEMAKGRSRLRKAVGEGSGPVVGFFIEASGSKRLSQAWWRKWIASMKSRADGIRLLQVLPPGPESAPLERGVCFIREADPRRLAAVLSQLDLFVSCDAGPMHLAAAAGTPTIGLFHASLSACYEPLGERCRALDVRDLTPAQTALAVLEHRARDGRRLYSRYDLRPPASAHRRVDRFRHAHSGQRQLRPGPGGRAGGGGSPAG